MRRILILLLTGLLSAVIFLTGCSDDKETITNTVYVTDTLTVTDTFIDTPPAHMTGYMFVDPDLYMYADIYSPGPLEPVIDSVFVADSLALSGLWTSISVLEPVGFAVYDNVADSNRFSSGDIAEIRVYGGSAQSAVAVKLLNFTEDSVVIVAPAEGASIDTAAVLTVIWQGVESADWYGLSLQYTWAIDAEVYTQSFIASTPDTQFIIDSSLTPFHGEYEIVVVPVCGPIPESVEGNISGNAVAGTIYSLARGVSRLTTIGDGLPPANIAAASENRDALDLGRELVEILTGERSSPGVRKLR
jgi:hypothetical protein